MFFAWYFSSNFFEKNQSTASLLSGEAHNASLCHSRLLAGFHTRKTIHYSRIKTVYIIDLIQPK